MVRSACFQEAKQDGGWHIIPRDVTGPLLGYFMLPVVTKSVQEPQTSSKISA